MKSVQPPKPPWMSIAIKKRTIKNQRANRKKISHTQHYEKKTIYYDQPSFTISETPSSYSFTYKENQVKTGCLVTRFFYFIHSESRIETQNLQSTISTRFIREDKKNLGARRSSKSSRLKTIEKMNPITWLYKDSCMMMMMMEVVVFGGESNKWDRDWLG